MEELVIAGAFFVAVVVAVCAHVAWKRSMPYRGDFDSTTIRRIHSLGSKKQCSDRHIRIRS